MTRVVVLFMIHFHGKHLLDTQLHGPWGVMFQQHSPPRGHRLWSLENLKASKKRDCLDPGHSQVTWQWKSVVPQKLGWNANPKLLLGGRVLKPRSSFFDLQCKPSQTPPPKVLVILTRTFSFDGVTYTLFSPSPVASAFAPMHARDDRNSVATIIFMALLLVANAMNTSSSFALVDVNVFV